MKHKNIRSKLTCVALLSLAAGAHTYGLEDDFESYPAGTFSSAGTNVFGDWDASYVDSSSSVGVVDSVTGNATKVLQVASVDGSHGTLVNDAVSYSGGTVTITFDFMQETVTDLNANAFFYARADGADSLFSINTAFSAGLEANEYRIGSVGEGSNYASEGNALIFDTWYTFTSTIDLDNGTFDWQILDSSGIPTNIAYSDLAYDTGVSDILESIRFGKLGSAGDMTLNVDNISVIPEPTSYGLGLGTIGLIIAGLRKHQNR